MSIKIYAKGLSEQEIFDLYLQGRLPLTCGDLNLDGNRLDLTDLTVLISIFNNETQKPPHWRNGDMNGDGEITFTDLTILSDHIGLLTPEPTCQPNTYCEATPKGECVNYNYCDGTDFVNDRCDICGCPSGDVCPTEKGTNKICQVTIKSDKGGLF